jgi:hypothetical protein
MWFAASLLFKSNLPNEPEAQALWEERIVLIRAADEEEARMKAEDIGKRREHEYPAAAGNPVRWTFEKIESVRQILGDHLEHGTEVYSRFLSASEVESLLTRFSD